MPNIDFTVNLELDPWVDLKEVLTDPDSEMYDITRIGLLPRGTNEGRATVAFVLQGRESGKIVMAETTLRLFQAVAGAVRGAPITQLEDQ